MNIGAVQSSAAPSAVELKRQGTGTANPQQGLNGSTTNDTNSTDRKELEKAVSKMNQTADIYSHDVKFAIHERSHRVMVQVLKKNTDEVITEMPPKLILDMVAQFQEMVGLLVDKKA